MVPGPLRNRTTGEHDPGPRRPGGRVGTTVARALESAADVGGRLSPAAGWTDLVLGPDHAPRVVNALITGWHEPEAAHLLLLEAVAGPELVEQAYTRHGQAIWVDEFGDSCLLLPML